MAAAPANMFEGHSATHRGDQGVLGIDIVAESESVLADRELLIEGSADGNADRFHDRSAGGSSEARVTSRALRTRDGIPLFDALCERRGQVVPPIKTLRLQERDPLSRQTTEPGASSPEILSGTPVFDGDFPPSPAGSALQLQRVYAVEELDDLIACLQVDGSMTEAEQMLKGLASEASEQEISPQTRVAAIDDLGPLLQVLRSKASFTCESDYGGINQFISEKTEDQSPCSAQDKSDRGEEYAVWFHDPNAVDESARQIQDMALPPRPLRLRRRRRINPKNFPKGSNAGKGGDERTPVLHNLSGLLDDLDSGEHLEGTVGSESDAFPQIEVSIAKPAGNQPVSKMKKKRGQRDGSPDESGAGHRIQQPDWPTVLPPTAKDMRATMRVQKAVRSFVNMAKGSAEAAKDRADAYISWEAERDGLGCRQREVKNSIELAALPSAAFSREVQTCGSTAGVTGGLEGSQTTTSAPLCPQPPPGKALRRAPSFCNRVRRCVTRPGPVTDHSKDEKSYLRKGSTRSSSNVPPTSEDEAPERTSSRPVAVLQPLTPAQAH